MTHIFSAKGIFCLYREGMLLGANGKNLLNDLARTWVYCSSYFGDKESNNADLVGHPAFESVRCGLARFMSCQELLLGLTKVMLRQVAAHSV